MHLQAQLVPKEPCHALTSGQVSCRHTACRDASSRLLANYSTSPPSTTSAMMSSSDLEAAGTFGWLAALQPPALRSHLHVQVLAAPGQRPSKNIHENSNRSDASSSSSFVGCCFKKSFPIAQHTQAQAQQHVAALLAHGLLLHLFFDGLWSFKDHAYHALRLASRLSGTNLKMCDSYGLSSGLRRLMSPSKRDWTALSSCFLHALQLFEAHENDGALLLPSVYDRKSTQAV